MSLTVAPERPDSPDAVGLIDALEAGLAALYPPENRYGLSVAALLDPRIAFFVGRIDGTPAACAGFKREEGYVEVKRMFVRPEFRGRGVGRAMLDRLEAEARAEGFTLLRLETGIHQTEAIRLYERAGFVRCAPFGPWAEAPDPMSLYFEKGDGTMPEETT